MKLTVKEAKEIIEKYASQMKVEPLEIHMDAYITFHETMRMLGFIAYHERIQPLIQDLEKIAFYFTEIEDVKYLAQTMLWKYQKELLGEE